MIGQFLCRSRIRVEQASAVLKDHPEESYQNRISLQSRSTGDVCPLQSTSTRNVKTSGHVSVHGAKAAMSRRTLAHKVASNSEVLTIACSLQSASPRESLSVNLIPTIAVASSTSLMHHLAVSLRLSSAAHSSLHPRAKLRRCLNAGVRYDWRLVELWSMLPGRCWRVGEVVRSVLDWTQTPSALRPSRPLLCN